MIKQCCLLLCLCFSILDVGASESPRTVPVDASYEISAPHTQQQEATDDCCKHDLLPQVDAAAQLAPQTLPLYALDFGLQVQDFQQQVTVLFKSNELTLTTFEGLSKVLNYLPSQLDLKSSTPPSILH